MELSNGAKTNCLLELYAVVMKGNHKSLGLMKIRVIKAARQTP